jgi:hypothetical protein
VVMIVSVRSGSSITNMTGIRRHWITPHWQLFMRVDETTLRIKVQR